MFNLASITTRQGIHLAGILTEAIHTPLMQDRYSALGGINYVFNVAKNFGDEIEFREDGLIVKRARKVLDEVEKFLIELKGVGLMQGIANGFFADISRGVEGGKGLEGVIEKAPGYSNPIMALIEKGGVLHD